MTVRGELGGGKVRIVGDRNHALVVDFTGEYKSCDQTIRIPGAWLISQNVSVTAGSTLHLCAFRR